MILKRGAPMSGRERREFRYRDDVVISYEVEGTGPTTLVFLHGFAAALTTWDDIRDFFPTDLCRLYFLDLKGFGRSSKPDDSEYGPTDQAAVVTAFLEAEGVRQAVLVGHSLGGAIALISCLDALEAGRSELVGGLILIDGAAYNGKLPPMFRLLRIPLLGPAMLRLLPVSFMVRFVLTRIYHDRKSVTPARIARYTEVYDDRESARVLVDTARQLIPPDYPAIVACYPEIRVPVLIVWGKHDPLLPVADGVRLRHDIPGSRLAVIDACGHNPHEEEAERTYGAISEFLDHFFLNRPLK